MSEYLIKKSTLTDLTDKLRDKFNTSEEFTGNKIANKIRNYSNETLIGVMNKTITKVYSENITCIRNNMFAGCESLTDVYLPNVTEIGENAFSDSGITNADFPSVVAVGSNAFSGCNLENANFPLLEDVGYRAFSSYWHSETLYLPNAKHIGIEAFANNYSIKYVNLPLVETIESKAFYNFGDNAIVSLNLPSVKTIGSEAFDECRSLRSLYAPVVESIAGFEGSQLSSLDLPEAITIGGFSYNRALTRVNIPKVKTIKAYAFVSCTALKFLDLPSVTFIGNNAFQSCYLQTLILRANQKCSLENRNAINSSTYIYVPKNLLDQYKSDSVWSNFSSRLRAIEDYPDICGVAE